MQISFPLQRSYIIGTPFAVFQSIVAIRYSSKVWRMMWSGNGKVKLSEPYERVLENLQHSTPEIKALALDALDIKVYARGTDDVEIQGVIPLELPTTVRTSA